MTENVMTSQEFIDFYEDIEHHGILGMKWGVRRTPEELGHYRDKKLRKTSEKYANAMEKVNKISKGRDLDQMTSRQKKRITKQIDKAINATHKSSEIAEKYEKKIKKAERKETIEAEKAQEKAVKQAVKQKKIDEKNALKNQKEAAKNAEKKEKLLKDLNADEIYKNRNLFSDNEINAIINRINTEKRLKDVNKKSFTDGLDKVEQVFKKAKGYADTAISVYDTVNKVKGILDKRKDKPLRDQISKAIKNEDYVTLNKLRSKMTTNELKDLSSRQNFLKNTIDANEKVKTQKEREAAKDESRAEQDAFNAVKSTNDWQNSVLKSMREANNNSTKTAASTTSSTAPSKVSTKSDVFEFSSSNGKSIFDSLMKTTPSHVSTEVPNGAYTKIGDVKISDISTNRIDVSPTNKNQMPTLNNQGTTKKVYVDDLIGWDLKHSNLLNVSSQFFAGIENISIADLEHHG